MISGVLLYVVFGINKNIGTFIRKNITLISIVGLSQTFGLYLFFYLGINIVPSSIAAIVLGISPLLAGVISHLTFKNDKLTVKSITAMIMGVIGITVLSLSRRTIEGDIKLEELWGICLLLVGSVLSIMGNVFVAKDSKSVNPFLLNAGQLFMGGMILFLVGLPFENFPQLTKLPLKFYLVLAWLSLLSACAFSLWFYLLQLPEVKVSALNMWKFIIPVFGAIFSWILIDSESPTLGALVGMIFISSSIVIYFRK